MRVLCFLLCIILVNRVWKLHLWICGFEKFAYLCLGHLMPTFTIVNSTKFTFTIDEIVCRPIAVAVSTPNSIVVDLELPGI